MQQRRTLRRLNPLARELAQRRNQIVLAQQGLGRLIVKVHNMEAELALLQAQVHHRPQDLELPFTP